MKAEELKKIAKRYAQDELKDSHSAVEDVVAAAFLNGIDYAEHHPHWISVEDELPPMREILGRSDIVIVCTAEEKSGIAYYNYVNKAWVSSATRNVTHWMPLPPAPKKGGEQ